MQVHATLEEELFYPAARSCLSDQDLVDEAEVEHMTVKVLIEQLKNMGPEDDKYAAMFKVLGEYINHHVKEEEGELFPKLGRAKFDWDGLHDEMKGRRAELEQEFMPHAAAVPDEDMEGVDAQSETKSRPASAARAAPASCAARAGKEACERKPQRRRTTRSDARGGHAACCAGGWKTARGITRPLARALVPS